MEKGEKMLMDFGVFEAIGDWQIVNDGVMGGLSTSEIQLTGDGTAVFQGEVSLENYGGFASVRTAPEDFGIGGYGGLMLRVRGDGKRYQLRVKTDDLFDGVAHQVGFDTRPAKWAVIRVPFDQFRATFRGRTLPDVPRLDASAIRQIGFLIAGGQSGPFRLEIAWVKAYRD